MSESFRSVVGREVAWIADAACPVGEVRKACERILAAAPVPPVDLALALDSAIWGMPGEPRRCARCNTHEGKDHSETCPYPKLIDVLWRARDDSGQPSDPEEAS